MKNKICSALIIIFLSQSSVKASPIQRLVTAINTTPLMKEGLSLAAIGLKITYIGYLAVIEDTKHPWEERGTMRWLVLPGYTAFQVGLLFMSRGELLYAWYYSNNRE